MELPRMVSRVGNFAIEHRRIALVSATVLPLGAIAARVLSSRSTAQEASVRDTPNSLSMQWWSLDPITLERTAEIYPKEDHLGDVVMSDSLN